MNILLASASPRRRQLLEAAGFSCDVRAMDVDERRLTGESPAEYVARVAALKADAARAQHPNRVVVAADTTVVVDNDVFGKPADAADATRMLRALSGRSHLVMTGVSLRGPNGPAIDYVETTTVWIDSLSDSDIAWYVRSGEPMDKAGAYAVQGLASRFVSRLEGSYSNVVGLPVASVAKALVALSGRPDGEVRTDAAPSEPVASGAQRPYPDQ